VLPPAVGLVVADVDHDVEPGAAVCRHRRVHAGVEPGDDRLDLWPFTAGP
jgi:hypothetical protein